MFKLVVLSVLLAVVAAKPSAVTYSHGPVVQNAIAYTSDPVYTGYNTNVVRSGLGYNLVAPEHSVYNYHPEVAVAHSTIAKVGEIVEKVPTAVSHQSSTVVHNSANVVTPIVAPVAAKTVITPAHVSYSAPLHHETLVAAAPVAARTVLAPAHVSYSDHLVHGTIVGAGPGAYSAPLHARTYSYGSPYAHGAQLVNTW